jgi:hypothetical protein
MKNMRLTKAGTELLGTAHADGETRFWIGYYGLAYVADRENDNIKDATQSGKLTKNGDYIFNIWQGDMLNGYAQNNPEDTAAASLFGLTLYDKSIRTNYRYVYDPDTGRNRLVAWKSESTGNGENTLERKGAAIYWGTKFADGETTPSELPLPAPLYYGGESNTTAIVTASENTGNIPVSADYRYYVGTKNAGDFGWVDSGATQDNETVSDETLLTSISNFNKFHGTVSSEGYGVSSVSSCHNMSKATKLFPISYYNVINDNGKKLAETQYSDNSPARKPLATAIKFSIDLSPVTADTGYTALNYEDGGIVEDQAVRESDLYSSKYISFKFNRIGIYAVPMTIHRYSTDSSTDECNMQKVQFEIAGDEEPVLFAIADVNDTIISDNPSAEEGGVAKFSLEFILNIGNGDEETSIEQRTAVYYNLYENDATTWYKNQLLASASISEAVTDLSLEMNALKQHMGGEKECRGQEIDINKYALKNHTHDYLKSFIDGVINEGSVRGIYTCEEGDGSDIKAVFGLRENAPEGVKKSCTLDALSEMVDGEVVTIPDSYMYCIGPVDMNVVPSENLLSLEQLKAIMQHKDGILWIVHNLSTNGGWYGPDDTVPNDVDRMYIWVSPTKYARVDRQTEEIVVNEVDPGSTAQYQAITIKAAAVEPLFSVDGYSVGQDSLVLGDNTAAAGKFSLVQGSDTYSDSDYATILGTDKVRCVNSEHTIVLGASGLDVKDCSHSILFGSTYPEDTAVKLQKINYSVVGGRFYEDDEVPGFVGGISASLWLAHENGTYKNGASGSVNGSILTGHAYFAKSVDNSVFLCNGEDPSRMTFGSVYDSLVLGEGYSVHSSSSHDDIIDEDISYNKSVAVATNVHNYFTESEKNYRDFKGETFTAPSLSYSVAIEGNVMKSISSSLILSSGRLDVARFSVNSKLDGTGGYNNIITSTGSRIGTGVYNSILLGDGQYTPDGTYSFIRLGGGMNTCDIYDDVAIPLSEFNAQVSAGTIANGDYAILGDGELIVWDDASSAYQRVTLSGASDHIYFGITVTDKHPKYVPSQSIVRTMTSGNDPTSTIKWSRTISLGSTKNYRVNSGALSAGIDIGGRNSFGCPGIGCDTILCVGQGNNGNYTQLNYVSIVGSGNSFGGAAYGAEGDTPLYPKASNVHVFGSGMTFGLGSLDPFATHEYNDAFVFLNPSYNLHTLGIFDHPMAYYSQPNDQYPDQSWTIAYSDPEHKGFFTIDPILFDNYKRAWIAKDPTNGEAIWNAYNVTVGTNQPSGTSVTWAQVTAAAEADEQDSDVYRGYDLFGFKDPYRGMTRAEIRKSVGKPNAPMVYTGGITLAGMPPKDGESYDKNFGLIKLGHVSKPVAYINTFPVDGWNAGGNLIYPVSVTGTTSCPFGGMMLAIDHNQEADGTMHLVLSRGCGSGVNTTFTRLNITVNGDITETMKGGSEYNIGGTSGTLTFGVESMQLGEESLIIVPSSGASVKISEQTLNAGTTYLIRRIGYNASEDSAPSVAVLAIPCFHIH